MQPSPEAPPDASIKELDLAQLEHCSPHNDQPPMKEPDYEMRDFRIV